MDAPGATTKHRKRNTIREYNSTIILISLCTSLSRYRKAQLMEKFQADNKSFSPERVEEEVDRFMMDSEMVNGYISYLKDRKANPAKYANAALEEELSLSNPKTVSGGHD